MAISVCAACIMDFAIAAETGATIRLDASSTAMRSRIKRMPNN
jgi:hypothetical protein